MNKIFVAFLTTTLLIIGCTGTKSDQKTNFRVFNGVPDVASLDFVIDFESFFTGVRYLEGSGYFSLDSGQHTIEATVTNSFTSLADSTTTLADDQDYTLLVFGLSTSPSDLLLRDDNEAAGKNFAKIRLVNASQASRNIDIYILAPSVDINSATPTEESLNYRQVTRYLSSQAGKYIVTVAAKDSKEILAQTSVQDLESEGVYTLIVADSNGGVLPPRIVVLKDR